MTIDIMIREETPDDRAHIYELTTRAFAPMPFAGGDEQDVINRLRETGRLSLSLVATLGERVIGQVTFSPAQEQGRAESAWSALGPVSVEPEFQGTGVGSALIETGLEQIRNRGALGCILTGNPAYYQRFGFALAPAHTPTNEPAEYFMLKTFSDAAPVGRFSFDPAFYPDS